MATHSCILAWRIPWTEETGGLKSTGCKESDTPERLTVPFFLSLPSEPQGTSEALMRIYTHVNTY